MDLPDCPPGTEGYQDTVTEVPRKLDDPTCTKAEQEFHKHLNSLKIKLEDGSTRPMVERASERSVSGSWTYLCYPCAAVCNGESILQTHISGKKHKNKLASVNMWPKSIFDDHPYYQQMKAAAAEKAAEKPVKHAVKVVEKGPQNMSVESDDMSDLEKRFAKYKDIPCHLQESLDAVKTPLVGLEYLVEHSPPEPRYSPTYMCTLCGKQGQPRTIVNHLTSFGHRINYIVRHFSKASSLLTPYRYQMRYREGVSVVINRLAKRIEDKYGRKRIINIDKEEYEKDKELIHKWIFLSHHFAERDGCTFEEVVDIGLIDSLQDTNVRDGKDPSPPVVAAPSKPQFNHFSRSAGRQERRTASAESLSDISDVEMDTRRDTVRPAPRPKEHIDRRGNSPIRNRYAIRNFPSTNKSQEKTRPPNYEYKMKLVTEMREAAEEFSKKTLAYHEKNPEKHPLYPEEWKKFWNKRYKEIQAEGKDASKHDFKPEWIVFWTARMKVLHEEELRVNVNEIYRKMCLSPPPVTSEISRDSSRYRPIKDKRQRSPDVRRRSPDVRRRSPDLRRRSPDVRRRSPDVRRRSPDIRRRSPEVRRRSPDMRNRSPGPRRRTPEAMRRRSPEVRHRSPLRRRSPDVKRDRRSPIHPSPPKRRSPERLRSPISQRIRTRSRSPIRRSSPGRRAPLQLMRGSRSPLSQREMQPRNRSPEHARSLAPSLQTVLISDEELKPDDGLSPWNSDNEIESVGSADSRSLISGPRKRVRSRRKPRRLPRPDASAGAKHAAPDDVVATLRLLVALEDYLGSLGPRLVDLLGEALKMEKEKPNSSEELLVRESAMVLIETAKEKLKGASQAGLVAGSAGAAARAAVVRAAATLHEADKRMLAQKTKTKSTASKSAMPVAGVGEVDRAQIAQQMAEALIAQGKTDVSAEELAQLVDAVVGMAEAKKREAERHAPRHPPPSARPAASALQMLQSAYDENDKKIEKDEIPDAMDGLSDSDLETLLKNFNELSAEEQHSLIAYLKKLEAREPARVERLRQYVSEAAPASAAASASAAAPAPAPASASAPAAAREPAPIRTVVVESDDDDYTVEEVFQSATQKVKEDQIRQEMEIVKKSLEGVKPSSTSDATAQKPTASTASNISSIVDITKNLSSASDLFALVQASLKSTPAPTPAPIVQPPEVVASSSHPRSFGDLPQGPTTSHDTLKPLISLLPSLNNQPAPSLRNPLLNFMDKNNQLSPSDHLDQGSQHSTDSFYQGSVSSHGDHFIQGNPPQGDRFNQGNPPQGDRFNQANPPQGDLFNQANQPQVGFNQNNPPTNDCYNHNNQTAQDRFGHNNQPLNDQYSNQPLNDHYNQGNQLSPSTETFNQGNQGNQWNARPNNFPLDNRGPPRHNNPRSLLGAPDNYGPGGQYNQVPNFMNRAQDINDSRKPNNNPQFGIYDNQSNFRGRGGRGRFMRGRGRGQFY